jgi:hypothetical protein
MALEAGRVTHYHKNKKKERKIIAEKLPSKIRIFLRKRPLGEDFRFCFEWEYDDKKPDLAHFFTCKEAGMVEERAGHGRGVGLCHKG